MSYSQRRFAAVVFIVILILMVVLSYPWSVKAQSGNYGETVLIDFDTPTPNMTVSDVYGQVKSGIGHYGTSTYFHGSEAWYGGQEGALYRWWLYDTVDIYWGSPRSVNSITWWYKFDNGDSANTIHRAYVDFYDCNNTIIKQASHVIDNRQENIWSTYTLNEPTQNVCKVRVGLRVSRLSNVNAPWPGWYFSMDDVSLSMEWYIEPTATPTITPTPRGTPILTPLPACNNWFSFRQEVNDYTAGRSYFSPPAGAIEVRARFTDDVLLEFWGENGENLVCGSGMYCDVHMSNRERGEFFDCLGNVPACMAGSWEYMPETCGAYTLTPFETYTADNGFNFEYSYTDCTIDTDISGFDLQALPIISAIETMGLSMPKWGWAPSHWKICVAVYEITQFKIGGIDVSGTLINVLGLLVALPIAWLIRR